ncbi:MAG TPA: sigma-70 family RNA polymerase sigma factor [Opitutaceae bacterium]|nr:sigma-70 family RNA polymerase sigma factor [Opitutaceae bacterium]
MRCELPAMPGSGSGDAAEDFAGGRSSFETTQWSIVLDAAGDQDSAKARAALETLCRNYWHPLFIYLRRRGYNSPDAQDLVQGFFARLLERNDLQAVRKERGRFRSYLLAGLKNFLVNDWRRAGAEKRGGGQVPIPLDDLIHQQSGELIAADHRTPDQAFDRQWAIALLARVLARLQAEYSADGRDRQFACLQDFLTGQQEPRPQGEIAAELGMSEGAVKQAVFRLRQRYQKLLRTEIAQTVATIGDVEEELRHLVAALRA